MSVVSEKSLPASDVLGAALGDLGDLAGALRGVPSLCLFMGWRCFLMLLLPPVVPTLAVVPPSSTAASTAVPAAPGLALNEPSSGTEAGFGDSDRLG